jgi:hypothetical protein
MLRIYFRTAGFAVFLYFYEGFTQTLSTLFRIAGFISLRRLPSELGVLKPFQQNAAHFVGFFNARQLT